MSDELEARIRRTQVTGKGESCTDGLAERRRLEAERQVTERVTEEAKRQATERVTEDAENAAVSRWAAPVSGTHVDRGNEAARVAKKAREAGAAARGSAAERRE